MHKCITDVIYYIVCISVSVSLYLLLYMFVYTIFNRFRIACAAADGWNYVMHIKWQLFAAKQLSFGGPNLNSRRQKARTHRRRQKDTHILTHKERHTQQRQATVGSRNARCKCGIMPKSSVENVSPQSSKERGGASLM